MTLTLPAVNEADKYDIVFVMDASSSTNAAGTAFPTRVENLLNAIEAAGADVKVGVVKFRGIAFDTISLASDNAYSGLVEYSAETAAAIDAGIQYSEALMKTLSSGSNIHSGLRIADDWLTADTAVADSHKYVVLVSDCKSYIWNDENDVATSFYAQHLDKNLNNVSSFTGMPEIGQATGSMNKDTVGNVTGLNNETGTVGFAFTTGELDDAHKYEAYAALYAYGTDPSDDPAIYQELSGSSPYDARCLYAYKEDDAELDGTLDRLTITNAGSLRTALREYYRFTPAAGFPETVKYMELNPYEIIDNGDNTYSYDFSSPNPDFYWIHPDSLQKGLYKAGHLWTDMGDKYNTAVMVYDGVNHAKLSGAGLGIARSFSEWVQLPEISDFAANIIDDQALSDMFDAIENHINYLIQSGTVTDVITDDFTLIEEGVNTFRISVGGVSQTAAQSEAYKWVFGTAVDGVYPYEVEYDAATKTISWNINVPVENSKIVSLSYDLEIRDGVTTDEYETNASAVLEYTSFNGDTGTYTFEVPEVDYTYDPITSVTLTKTYVGGTGYDNEGAEVTTQGTLEEDVSFIVTPYDSFNREVGKTAIPAFDPGTY
ncbi:MAG: VWA domain-containing protein, partial [Clostridia bacterium]|nr:VWA domain-containing protein [Clostridia bacterium]